MTQLLNIIFSAIEMKGVNSLTSTDNSIKTNMYELCELLSRIIQDIDPDKDIAEHIAWMQPKLMEETKQIAMVEGKEFQIAILESKISENDNLIAEIEPKIKDQDKQIAMLEAQIKVMIKEKDDQIAMLKDKTEDKNVHLNNAEPKIENQEVQKAIIKDKDDQIEMLKSEIEAIKNETMRIWEIKSNEMIAINRKLKKQIREYYIMYTKYQPKTKLIRFPSLEPFKPTWDNKIAGPGWIVIQRRIDGNISFDRDWNAWKDGFGDPNGDFWLGLERLHRITTYQQHELYIHMIDHTMQPSFAQYNNFVVGSIEKKYELKSLGSYKGDAGDEMRACEKSVFSVYYGLWNPYNSPCQM